MDRYKLIALAIKYQGDYKKVYQAIKNDEDIQGVYDIKALTILDDDYPKAFWDLKLPPLVLFYHGDIDLLKRDIVGIIGSRSPCDYALRATKDLCNKLKEKYVIISGLAKGLDAMAHLEALSHQTIGVLGCGIDRVYPACNKELYAKMKKDHLIISEYPFDVTPLAHHFPFRNRLIAALSKKLFVMQANKKSGTLITVDQALELNRDIYALPFDIYDPNGEGTNHLIREGANMIIKEDIEMY